MDRNHLNEQSTFTGTVYEIATTDPVEGGPEGVDNRPHRELANRTRYLKDKVDALTSGELPAGKAALLAQTRTIKANGDASWSVAFNGERDVTAPITLAPTGVAAGTYRSVTTDAKGRIVAGSNPTTLEDYGITDAVPASDVSPIVQPNKLLRLNSAGALPADITGNAATASSVQKLTTPRAISLQGGVSGSTTFDGSANAVINVAVDPSKHAHDVITAVDSRHERHAPKDKPGCALSFAFKTMLAADNPPVNANANYAHVMSSAGWNAQDGSGGWPSEISVGDGLAVRQGISATTWGPWRNVLTDHNISKYAVPLHGAVVSGRIVLQKNNAAIINESYGTGNLELSTLDGSSPMLSFHRNGYTAVTLYHNGYGLRMRSTNGGEDSEFLNSINYAQYALPLSGGTVRGNVTFASASPYCDNWFRSIGATGWFNETYGGGIFMNDADHVRVYNGKHFVVQGNLHFGSGLSQGRLYIDYASQPNSTFLFRDNSVLLAGHNSQHGNLFTVNEQRQWSFPTQVNVGGNLVVSGVASAVTAPAAAEDMQLATTEWVKRNARQLLRDHFASSLGAGGGSYQYIAGGMIIQAGTITTVASPQTITFPLAFPNACIAVVGSVDANATSAVEAFAHSNITRSNFQIFAGQTWGGGVAGVVGSTCWIAIGF